MQQMVELIPVNDEQLDDFISRLKTAFTRATLEKFPDFLGYVPAQRDIDDALDDDNVDVLDIVHEGKSIGGAVITGGTTHKTLEFIFIDPDKQNSHLGQAAWQKIEARYPDTKIWELVTAYHEKRNIHFYVNRCGFHIVEYFNQYHEDPEFSNDEASDYPGADDGLFRFVKVVD
ncbi:MAG: GNAT family N-acetyltransferase [Eggerthellaceae bacterium]|nr:GNAT family N-acetyltransferase [Eggerthellaceae bacterium]